MDLIYKININNLITIILILFGSAGIFFSAIGTNRILKKTITSRYSALWKILLFLMLFFLLGYLGTIVLILIGLSEIILILTGVVFFFGALFVFLVVRTGYLTISELVETSVSKSYVENIINSMNDALAVIDKNGFIQTVNQSLIDLIHDSEKELKGLNISEIHKDLDSAYFRKIISQLSKTHTISDLKFDLVTKEDQLIPVYASLSAMRTPEGKITGYIYTAQDISELIKAQKEAETARNEMNEILSNVNEGLFLLNRENGSYVIGNQHSKALNIILEDDHIAHTSMDDLLKNKVKKGIFKSGIDFIDLMFKKDVKETFLPDLNPLSDVHFSFFNEHGFEYKSKDLQFQFNRILKDGNIENVMGIVRDITEEKLLELQLKEAKESAETQQELLFNMLHVDPRLLSEFIEETKLEIEKVRSTLENTKKPENYKSSLDQIFRSIHTIKGNADVLNLKIFAKKAHSYEENIIELKEKEEIKGVDFLPLTVGLNDIWNLLNETDDLVKKIIAFQDFYIDGSQNSVNKLMMDSFQKSIDRLNQDLNKNVAIDYSSFNYERIPEKHRQLFKEIVNQFIRNSMFHGFESVEERKSRGKDKNGKIVIQSEFQNANSFEFYYYDDGRGIQIDKLKKKALENGKWTEKELESWDLSKLIKLIYLPGMSTAEEAGLGAGRGIGMDLVKKKIQDAGGKIQVSFIPGRQCKFKIFLPNE